ncbi:MAG: flagellar motor switch protein FliN [Acidobacteriota bacterium]
MNSSNSYKLTNQQKVLEPLFQAFGAGFSEASRSSLHSTASAACIRMEPVSLRDLTKPGPSLGIEIQFDSGISGSALLVMAQSDVARLGGLLSGLEAPEGEPIDTKIMEACLQFFASALKASGQSLALSCGLSIQAAAPRPINPAGDNDALLQLDDAYSDAMGLNLQLKVENCPDTSMWLLMRADLLASLNAQLPQYAGSTSGGSSAADKTAAGNANPEVTKQQNSWNIDLILDVELEVAVSFGGAQMALRDILKLGVGSVIDLEKGVNDPVTISVNDKPIAHGEVVVVDGNYGVKVMEVESTADRIRSLG